MKVFFSFFLSSFFLLTACTSAYFESLTKKDYVPYTQKRPINDENIASNLELNRDGLDKKIYINLIPRRMAGEFDLNKNQYITLWPFVIYDLRKNRSEYRLRIQYDAHDLLFITSFHAYCGGEELELNFDYFKERHFDLLKSGGYVREWFEKKISQRTVNFFKKCKEGDYLAFKGKEDFYEEFVQPYISTYFFELEYVKKDLDDEKIMRLEDLIKNSNQVKKNSRYLLK